MKTHKYCIVSSINGVRGIHLDIPLINIYFTTLLRMVYKQEDIINMGKNISVNSVSKILYTI